MMSAAGRAAQVPLTDRPRRARRRPPPV